MDLPFGVGGYAREEGNIAELPLVNLYAEAAPSEGKVVLQSRQGISLNRTVGSGPIKGLFKKDGVLSGVQLALSGTTLYNETASLGTVAGSGFVSITGTELQALINAGEGVYATDGASFDLQAFPENANVIKVFELAGYALAIREDSARFYWRLWGIDTWDELDYATAENEPDKLLDGLAIDDYLVLFGAETIEFWPKTGDSELPFEPTPGRVFEKGIKATGCACPFDNTVAWVTNENLVCRAGNVPERISNSGIEERIANSASVTLQSFYIEGGHELLMLRLDDFTGLYDAQTGEWHEWQSYGRDNFRGQTAISGPLFGDDTDGSIWEFDGYDDNGGVLERRFRAGSRLEIPFVINCIRLTCNVGWGDSATYPNPVVEMRSSRDAGNTWTPWRSANLGAVGEYLTRTEWRRCGMFADPGMIFEFRVTDPVPFRVSKIDVNPNYGGRSR